MNASIFGGQKVNQG